MSKWKFLGVLLITTGAVLVLVGLFVGIPDFDPRSKDSANEDRQNSANPEGDVISSLVVNLPAPRSIVASPLLIRGKVYGGGKSVAIRLLEENSNILVDTVTFPQDPNGGQKSVRVIQTSLVFDQPESRGGKLQLQLRDDDFILAEEFISVTFRGN